MIPRGSLVKYLLAGTVIIGTGIAILLSGTHPTSGDKKTVEVEKKAIPDSNSNETSQSNSFSRPEVPVPASIHHVAFVEPPSIAANAPLLNSLKAKYGNVRVSLKGTERKNALREFGRELARENPVVGFEFIKLLALDMERFSSCQPARNSDIGLVCQGYFQALAEKDINAALARAKELLPWQLRQDGLGTVMKTWARSDLSSALAYLDKLPDDLSAHGADAVFSVWGERDPETALAGALKDLKDYDFSRIKSLDSLITMDARIRYVIEGWAGVDPEAAWKFVLAPNNDFPAIRGNQQLLGVITDKWAEKDLTAAMAAARTITGDTAKAYENKVVSMIWNLLDSDPTAAETFLNQEGKWLTENPFLSHKNVMRLLDEGSFTEAANWINQNITDKDAAFKCARDIASKRTAYDYDAVLKWVTMIENDYIRAGALGEMAEQQGRETVNRPIDWINNLPGGYTKDRCVTGYVLGQIRLADDLGSEKSLCNLMDAPQIDMTKVAQIIERAKIQPRNKSILMDMVKEHRLQQLIISR